jgi:hypothetical protein
MVTPNAAEAALVSPSASVAVAVKLCLPSAKEEVGMLHEPSAAAIVVPIGVFPS